MSSSNTPMANIRAGGKMNVAAATGVVSFLKTRMAYIKQIVTLLLGSAPGAPLHTVVAGVKTTVAGATIITATGTVFIKAVHVKKLTSDETNIGTLSVISDDTVPLNLLLRKKDGDLVVAADFTTNASYVFDVGWVLATTKILKLASDVAGEVTNGYQIHVECYALTESASVA